MSAFLKNLPVKILGGRCLFVWGPRSPPPPVTQCMNEYMYPCICTYSHREGGGGGGRWTSEKVRGAPDPPLPPPRYTLYEYMYPCTCTYSHREGRRESRWTSEKVRGALVHKRGRKYQHDWLYLQSIYVNSLKHQERQHVGFGVFIDFGP